MLLKNHLIEVFKQASLENNSLLKDNIVLKWVHRFGIDSLNDLLIHSSLQKENQREEQNQEQISLMDEVDEEENQEQISLMDEVDEEENQEKNKLELSKTIENIEELKWESKRLETSNSNRIFSKDQNSNNIKRLTDKTKLPLPNIKNLRKWINNDKKAS
ncbi:glycoprotein [Prochlorococcus sp. AH-716-P08]|nr:glycoprotein [Prochlorococcus sp. AH-716-P08]